MPVHKGLALSAVSAALIAAACAGGEEALSAAEWVERANAICSDAAREGEMALETFGDKAQAADVIECLLPIARQAEADLRALEPPAELEKDVRRWLQIRAAQIRGLNEFLAKAKEGDEAALFALGFVYESFEKDHDKLANKLGVTECVDEDLVEGGPTLTLPSFPETLSPAEQEHLEQQLADELAAARARKRAVIAANRRALDSLPRFPGSRLVVEVQNPENDFTNLEADAEDELLRYARATLEDEDYATLTTESWGTFRTYAVPRDTEPAEVYGFFLTQLPGEWTVGRNEKTQGAVGEIFELSFSKGATCVWFLIGTRTHLPPGRVFRVAADRQGRDEFCRV